MRSESASGSMKAATLSACARACLRESQNYREDTSGATACARRKRRTREASRGGGSGRAPLSAIPTTNVRPSSGSAALALRAARTPGTAQPASEAAVALETFAAPVRGALAHGGDAQRPTLELDSVHGHRRRVGFGLRLELDEAEAARAIVVRAAQDDDAADRVAALHEGGPDHLLGRRRAEVADVDEDAHTDPPCGKWNRQVNTARKGTRTAAPLEVGQARTGQATREASPHLAHCLESRRARRTPAQAQEPESRPPAATA